MLDITSETVLVSANPSQVFAFLMDLNNLEKLMPQDKIEGWESNTETCSFRIKGMTGIGMKLKGSTPDSVVNIESHEKNPMPFTLDIYLTEKDGNTSAELKFSGDANPMIKMMAAKPLTNFFNILATNLKGQF